MSSAQAKPRILYFSTPWPYASIRAAHVAQALCRLGEVEVVVVDSEAIPYPSIPSLGRDFKVAADVPVQPCRPKAFSQKLRSALDPRCPYPHGLQCEPEAARRLLARLPHYDLVWFFKLRTANMFEPWSWPRSVVDVDDLPSGVYRTVQQTTQGFLPRLRARAEVLIWQRRERLLHQRFSVLAVCSEADRRCLRSPAPSHVIPNGFERPAAPPVRRPATPPRIGFIGLFDYLANVDGIRWFIERCWPLIKRDLPTARLRLVGRGSDRALGVTGPEVEGLGWVEDAAAEIASWSVMIVPLRIGGGVRVKIAEGFSRQCPVVATPLGAYGYEVQHERELLLAEEPEAFAAACVSLVRAPERAAALAERAYAAFLEKWTWDAIAPRVEAAARDCLQRNGRV